MYLTKFALVSWLIITNFGHTSIGYKTNQVAITPTKLFTRLEADRIIGSATHLTDSVSKKEASQSSYLCGYKADSKDQKTGKIGTVYFLFEAYNDIEGAKKRFSDVYLSNRANGAKAVDHLGDEALYHTDNENFDLMMVRKGKYVFNIKINTRTSTSSLSELKIVVKKITDHI